MSGTHFYLTLPSNASLNEFPNNKTTSYRVKLPQSIDLEGIWEVGLYSISYPNTWYTLQKGVDTHPFYADRTDLFQQAIMDYGYYQSMQELIKAANKALSRNVSDNIKLTYNAFTGKVTVQIKNGFQFAVMKPLSIILGFGGKDVMLKKTTESPYVADLTIYVYCDIVQPQIVGDTSAQLLKSIPAEGKLGDIIAKTFTNIQYVPIRTKSFEAVEVLLRNDTGDPVPFERGKVVITLHAFQKAQLFHIEMSNPYLRYYLDQQGHGMTVLRGSPWQIGHGQMGYGLGGLFRSVARAVMPMVKSGEKALENIGANFVGDVLAGKNVKEAAKARTLEAANVTKRKAVNKLMNQTGSGKRGSKQAAKKRLKREKHSHLLPETSRLRSGEQLLLARTYLVKYEFRTFQIARMHQE